MTDLPMLFDNLGNATMICLGVVVITWIFVSFTKGLLSLLVKLAAVVFCIWIFLQATDTSIPYEFNIDRTKDGIGVTLTGTGEGT